MRRSFLVEASPRAKARMAGLFYVLESSTAVFGQMVTLGRLVVPHDAAATAANILAHESLFRLGFASCLSAVGFHLAWALLFYQLFKPVNRSISLLALLAIIVGCAIQALASIFYIAPLFILRSGSPAFTAEQLQALAYIFLRLNGQTFNVYIVFFGMWSALTGYLIYRSTFMPGLIGALLALSGLGYMTHLSQPLASYLFPLIMTAAAFGELPLAVWLLVKGVNDRRWYEQAGTGGLLCVRCRARQPPVARAPFFVR